MMQQIILMRPAHYMDTQKQLTLTQCGFDTMLGDSEAVLNAFAGDEAVIGIDRPPAAQPDLASQDTQHHFHFLHQLPRFPQLTWFTCRRSLALHMSISRALRPLLTKLLIREKAAPRAAGRSGHWAVQYPVIFRQEVHAGSKS